jgi:recombination protein RecA
LGILRKSGAFYSFGDQRLGQGRENVKDFLKANPELADEIEAQIRAQMAGAKAPLTIGATGTVARNGAMEAAGVADEDEAEF